MLLRRLRAKADGTSDLDPFVRPVIHLVDSFGVGGCQTCLKVLSDYKGKQRRHIIVALRTVGKSLNIVGPFVMTVRSSSRLSLLPVFILLRLMKKTGPVILHCHLFRAQSVGLLLKILRPSSKLIFHERGRIYGREHEPYWEGLLFHFLLRGSRPFVDIFVANSKQTLGKLEEKGIHGRLSSRVIYNGIVTQIGKPSVSEKNAARKHFGIPSNGFVFGFAGRIIERKGWRDFIDVAGRFSEKANIFWLIAGTGKEAEEMTASIAGCLNPRILAIDETLDLTNFYRTIDCCIVPSHWEPHGLVHIEALSFGVPVIASDLPSLRETLVEGGDSIFFPPRDGVSLGARVSLLLSSDALQTALSQGALRNAQRFTVVNYNSEMEKCYKEL